MKSLESLISHQVAKAVHALFGQTIEPASVTFQRTNPQFEGDITLVVFPYVKMSGKGPEQAGQAIGAYLQEHTPEVTRFNVVKGFLNLVISDEFWLKEFDKMSTDEAFGMQLITETSPFVMVEYSSPNTNKPLHLGHIRNNLLGYSVSEVLKAAGNKVMKVNLVNDRGIHICKSMLAWKKFGNGETPASAGMKGDHLVGKYYVIYAQKEKESTDEIYSELKELNKELLANNHPVESFTKLENYYSEDKDVFRKFLVDEIDAYQKQYIGGQDWFQLRSFPNSLKPYLEKFFGVLDQALFVAVQKMLRKWEAGDQEVRDLWEMMNGWVYDGFALTYKKLGVDFDKTYYESQTYLLGKTIVEEGLAKGVLQKRPDGAVIIDNTDAGLDQKVLLRSDGTSVYMTQDLGTAEERHKEFPFDKHIYVVGNEQEYHFKTLKVSLKKLGHEWADGLFHLSYGMVELPEGKMKSREGTVVDADDLIDTMEKDAYELAQEKGLIEGLDEQEKLKLAHMVGMAALKYFILKVDPKKKMLFNPKESIDLHGNTGPFIQYTHARIRSIWRKSELDKLPKLSTSLALHAKEKELLRLLYAFPAAVKEAANSYSPALIANYTYDLAKTFNQFYDVCPVLKEEDATLRNFRLALSVTIARTIKTGMSLLGIEVPERM